MEARGSLYTGAQRKAEEIRVQVRKQHQASLKRGKYAKHSVELEEVSGAFAASAPALNLFSLVSKAYGSIRRRSGQNPH